MKELGEKYKIAQWIKTAEMFKKSGKLIIKLCKAAVKQDRKDISSFLLKVADIEENAYGLLK